MICHDLTEANEAIDALHGATAASVAAAKSFAIRMFSRGVSNVKVRGLVPGGFADWSDGGICLRYEGAAVTAHYYAYRDGREDVDAVTKHDNGHSGTMQVSPRAYGLIAAMLLART